MSSGHHPSKAIRRLDWTSVISYTVLAAVVAWRVAPHVPDHPVTVLTAVVLGYLAADLVSGLVHWGADTWGSPDVPVVGPALLGPFREHHQDPRAITRHDAIETNGNSCLASLPLLGIALWTAPREGGGGHLFLASFLLALAFWVMLTNQFHKWAHEPAPPRLVTALQRSRVILPPAHHQLHHTRPFSSHYCITTGWLNRPLGWIRLLPFLERCVVACTGAVPRRDDLRATAAGVADDGSYPLP